MIEQIILSDDRIQKFYRDNDLPFPIIIWLLIKAVIYKNSPSIRGVVWYLRWQLGFDSLTQIFCKYWYLKWQLGYDSLIQISSILGYRLEIFNYQRSGWLVLLFTVWPEGGILPQEVSQLWGEGSSYFLHKFNFWFLPYNFLPEATATLSRWYKKKSKL